MELGDWVGQDRDVAPDIVERAQTTEYLNRVYENRSHPGLRLTLWINYSRNGTNLRHTPEICLPSGGWTKIESQTKVLSVDLGKSKNVSITRLGYGQGELVKHVGFWYYIFGEGKLENFVRQLADHQPQQSRPNNPRVVDDRRDLLSRRRRPRW